MMINIQDSLHQFLRIFKTFERTILDDNKIVTSRNIDLAMNPCYPPLIGLKMCTQSNLCIKLSIILKLPYFLGRLLRTIQYK